MYRSWYNGLCWYYIYCWTAFIYNFRKMTGVFLKHTRTFEKIKQKTDGGKKKTAVTESCVVLGVFLVATLVVILAVFFGAIPAVILGVIFIVITIFL